MLTVENLSFQYRHGTDILKNVSFSLEDGQFLAILGNNGVGKSTMLKCFNKILTARQGHIHVDGEDLLQMTNREIAKRIAFVAQSIPDTQMTVHDIVMLGRRPYMGWSFSAEDHRIVHEAMGMLNLLSMRGRFLSQLSGGERQKVVLARALAQQPKILLLDEPTSSLDLQNQYQVLAIVRDICHHTGITSIVVIHDLNLALRFCDCFLLLKDGEVYNYGDASVINRKSILDVYGIHADVVSVKGHQIVIVDE